MPIDHDAWPKLVRRYAGSRIVCNCRDAYYTIRDGRRLCQSGCAANCLAARDEIAAHVLAELDFAWTSTGSAVPVVVTEACPPGHMMLLPVPLPLPGETQEAYDRRRADAGRLVVNLG